MIKKAVILAAGMGTRLLPLTKTKHKCLTEISGVPIIVNALSGLYRIGVEETTVVVGYLADDIKKCIGESFKTMRIKYVENSSFRETNTSYSLMLGLSYIDNYDMLYILEGDVFFEEKLLIDFSADEHENATVLEPYNPSLDGTFVTISVNKNVTGWIHKNYREANFSFDGKYKTVNIHKFNRDFVNTVLLPGLKIECGEGGKQAPLEKVMQSIVKNSKNMIYGIETGGTKWFEIDDCNDLKIAQKMFGDENDGIIERLT